MHGESDGRTGIGRGGVVVDSHHHYWRIGDGDQTWHGPDEQPVLGRDFLPGDLRPQLDDTGVDATVVIQSTCTAAENGRLLEYAADPAHRVAGVVAWLPLEQPETARRLLAGWSGAAAVRGVRDLWWRRELSFLLDDAARGLLRDLADRDLVWDTVPVNPAQVDVLLRILPGIPGLRVVVDHLARPPVPERGWEPWAGDVRRLAALPQVHCKLSVGIDVLRELGRWDLDALTPYAAHVLDAFGPERVLWASNWPVSLLAAPYEQTLALADAALREVGASAGDRAAVLGGTAARCYQLEPTTGRARA